MLLPPFFWQDVHRSFEEVLADHYILSCVWGSSFCDPRIAAVLIFFTIGVYVTLKNCMLLILLAIPVFLETRTILERIAMKISAKQYSRSIRNQPKKRGQT